MLANIRFSRALRGGVGLRDAGQAYVRARIVTLAVRTALLSISCRTPQLLKFNARFTGCSHANIRCIVCALSFTARNGPGFVACLLLGVASNN